MENYPANSQKAQPRRVEETNAPEDKKIEPVVTGEVTRRKRPLGKRLSETFMGGDARGVWYFVAMDVLLPAAREMVADAISQGVERMIYGETARPTGRRPGARRSNGTTVYDSAPSRATSRDPFQRGEDPRASVGRPHRRSQDIGDVVLASRVEADEVLDNMYRLLERYKVVTVADLCDLINETGQFTDDKFGWTSLHGSRVYRSGGRYVLALPRVEELD